MAETIDSLQIEINAKATKANDAIDRLVGKLDRLTTSLGRVNGTNLNGLANGVQRLGNAMQVMNAIKTADFTRLATNLTKLGSVNVSALNSAASSMSHLTRAMSAFSGVSFDNKNLLNMINGITRLSNSNVQSLASVDFSRLGISINQLATSLSNAPKIQQSVISMTNAIANLAESGQNIPIVAYSLGSLGQSMNTFMVSISSAPNVSENVISFAQAVGLLANSGTKAGITAKNLSALGVGLRNMMATLSKAPSVSQNVIQMTNAIANLASQGSKVGSASNSIVKGLNKTTTATKKAGSGFKGLASYIGKFYATYFMAIRGIKKLWSSIESTADYIEAYNYFNVSLGKIGSDWSYQFEQYGYENAESYVESFKTRLSDSLGKLSGLQVTLGAYGQGLLTESGMKNLGLNIQEITQYASQLASVTNSVGQTGEVSLAVASSFTKLAGDISSLFNVDYSSVSKNLQSGLIGQSRALYKYGIDITNATLQTYAYNLGLSKSVSEMTQAEKMQLRMLAILDQSKVSWGDLANTINSPSNMIRQFKNNLKETGMVLGQLFIPVLQKVLPVINGVSIAFKRLLVDIAGFLNINIDLDSFGQGYSDIGDELDDSADAFDKAIQKAEEYKNQLLGFDEVNKLTEDSSTDTNGVGNNSIDLTDSILAASSEYEKVWNKAYDKMENQATTIAGKVEKAFAPLKNIFKYFVAGDFEKSGTELAEWINKGLTDYDWGKIGTFIGNKITGTINFVSGFANNLDWKQLARDFTSVVNNAIKNIDVGALADAINGLLNGIWDFAVTTLETLDWGGLAKQIGRLLGELDYGVIAKIGFTVGVAKLAGKFLKIFSTNIKTGFTSVFSGLAKESKVVSGLTTVGSKMGTTLANAIKSPLMLIPAAAAIIISGISKSFDETAKNFENARGKVDEETQKIVDNATTVINKAKEVADSINTGYEDSTGEADGIQIIADKYFTLAEKVGKTKEEMQLLEAYKQELAEKGGSGIKDILDDETKSYEEQKEAIQGVIDNIKEKALTEAASKSVTGITETMLPLQSTIDELSDQEHTLKDEMNKANNEYKSGMQELETIMKYYDGEGGFKDAFKELGMSGEELHKRFRELQKTYSTITFNDSLPKALRLSNSELSEVVSSSDNFYKKAADAEANWSAVNQQLISAENQMKDLGVQMDYYVGISSGAISTETSLYEYRKQVAEAEKKAAEEAKAAAEETKATIDEEYKPENFTELGENVTDGITDGMNSNGKRNEVSNAAKSIRDLIKSSFDNSTDFVTFGKNILEGLKTGLSDNPLIKSITGTVTTIADKVKGIFPNIFDMHSPSKLFEQFGKYTLEGYEVGVEKNADKSVKAVRNWGYELQNMATASLPDFSYSSSPTYAQNTVSNNIYNNSEEVALLRQQVTLLQSLLAKDNVVISPDADGIFKMVQGKANNYTRQTGNSAFLV